MIITLANQKGGVGKTTTALNLAAVLRAVNTPPWSGPSGGSPILYVDTDKQMSGATVVQEAADAAAASAVTTRSPELNGRDITTDEPIGLPFDFYPATSVEEIEAIPEIARSRGYRHVLVDTAGSLDDLSRSEAAIEIADFALVPMLAEAMSRKPTQRTIETMIRPRMGDRFAVAIVNYESRNGTADLVETADWVVEQGYRLINTPVRSWRIISRNTICTIGRRTRPALEAHADYQGVAIEITQGA